MSALAMRLLQKNSYGIIRIFITPEFFIIKSCTEVLVI